MGAACNSSLNSFKQNEVRYLNHQNHNIGENYFASNFKIESRLQSQEMNTKNIQNLVNYVSQSYLIFIGVTFQLGIFQPSSLKSLILIEMFALNNQIKIVKKIQTNGGLAYFLQLSNLIILLHEYKLQIMQFTNFQELCVIKEINFIVLNFDTVMYQPLRAKWNQKENLLVITSGQCFFFIEKANNEWVCSHPKINHLGQILNVFSNESDNIAVFQRDHWGEDELKILFLKIGEDQQYKKIAEIELDQKTDIKAICTCLLDERKLSQMVNNTITFLEVCSQTQTIKKVQDLKLNSYRIMTQYEYIDSIVFIKSKELLLAYNQGILYLIKSNNEIFFIKEVIILSKYCFKLAFCKKGRFLVSNSNNQSIKVGKQILSLMRLCEQ